MIPNSPHMAFVDPGEGTLTCQVNHSTDWESNPDLPGTEGKETIHYTTAPHFCVLFYVMNLSTTSQYPGGKSLKSRTQFFSEAKPQNYLEKLV